MTSPPQPTGVPTQMYRDPEGCLAYDITPCRYYVYERSSEIPNFWEYVRLKTQEELDAEKAQAVKDEARRKAAENGDASRTALYRLRNAADELLYVGISANPLQRWLQHAADKAWWPETASMSLAWFDSHAEAAAMEIHAIRTERPRYNVVHNAQNASA